MKIRVLIIFILLDIASAAAQQQVEPFKTHNQSPLIHFFGIPNSSGGNVLSKKQFIFSNCLNIANNATSSQLQEEAIYLDGEMYRNDLFFRYGVSNKLQVEVNVPLIRHSTGLMDPFISGWHETFGLPGKSREVMSNHNLTYLYRENETTHLLLDEGRLDIGDIAVRLTTPILKKSYFQLSFSTSFKLSTGKKDNLIGSGTNDVSFNLSASSFSKQNEQTFTWFYSLGYLHIGSGAVLNDVLSNNVIFGSIGTAYHLSKRWIPKVQFDFHTGFYKGSTTRQLGEESIQLVIGTDFSLSKKLNLSAAFSEDLIVNTAPDFVLQFGVSYQL
ncbi:DUF3187 family protein [Marinifilum sp.]|uniref:DUF3187 family protein n=1 Tax=Marinifilum sp. TaxID=2033137 RepID=UPI003BAB5A1A